MAGQQGMTGFANGQGQGAAQDANSALSGIGRNHLTLRTRELVGMLLAHGARSWRASLPHTATRFCALSPSGRPAVRLRMTLAQKA